MGKNSTKTYKKVDSLTTQEIQSEVINLLSDSHKTNYYDEVKFVLNSFVNLIKSASVIGGYNNLYSTFLDDINTSVKSITKCIYKYLNGDIFSAYNTFYYRWRILCANKFHQNDSLFALCSNEQVYYRMRVSKNKIDTREEMFHVPFEERGSIGNSRFSISGFPCLYLSKSIYSCWEEMGRPSCSSINVSGYKCNQQINLLDLRLKQNIDSQSKEEAYIMLLPYIIASTIKTHSSDEKFKPEYIIPQILLHSVIKKCSKDFHYDGIIYTSTKRSDLFFYNDISFCDNIAIPVMSSKKSGYCKELAKYFSCTEPISFEAELMKGSFLCLSAVDSSKYQNSVYYLYEQVVKNKEYASVL